MGRVHTLPHATPGSEQLDRAVARRADRLLLPPEQEHMRMGIARTLAEGDIMRKENSLPTKIKNSLAKWMP